MEEADESLFRFSIKRSKKLFLTYALSKEIFSQKILNSEKIVKFLLKRLS